MIAATLLYFVLGGFVLARVDRALGGRLIAWLDESPHWPLRWVMLALWPALVYMATRRRGQ